MELLPKKIEKELPELYATEHIKTEEKILQVRYLSIYTNWEWYLVEYKQEEQLAFGYVKGHENEWGYFSLKEFQEINDESLKIVRDENFTPTKFKDIKELQNGGN